MKGLWLERYFLIRKAQNISPRTIESERKAHEIFWDFLDKNGFERSELDVSPADVEAYALWVNVSSGWAVNTKNQKLKMIRGFYKEAVNQEWRIDDPMINIKNPKRQEKVPHVLSVEQIKRILVAPDIETARGVCHRTMLEILYSTGMRSCSLLALKPEDFSEDYRLIKVTGKGSKEAMIPNGKMSAHFVKFWVEELRPKIKAGSNLFIDPITKIDISDASLRHMVARYGKQVGLKSRASPHVFRYSIATHLSEQRVDIRLIQELLMHDNINTTARYISIGLKRLRAIHSKYHPREVSHAK